jgi:hypothetical protein
VSPGSFFKPLAKAVAGATLMQKLFARMADRAAVERLLKDTGSKLDERGLMLYQRLFANEGHIAGTLGHDGGLGPALGGTGSAKPRPAALSREGFGRPHRSSPPTPNVRRGWRQSHSSSISKTWAILLMKRIRKVR